MTLLHNAQQYHAAGLSVLPARRLEKRPAIPSWKEFQKQLPSANHVAAWFANEHDALCVICGQVSGNLEVLDFDHQGELFDAWLAAIPQEICDRLVVEQTPSGGYHVAYRCPEGISGNLKLAVGLRDGKRMTLIETRGEGGLVLCAPTEGYELLQGDYAHLGALSGNERITLLDAAWRLNELVEENKAEKQANEDTRFTTRPGDDYNARGDFPALLQAHGWAYLRTMPDGNQHWRRPGKEGDHTSATLKDGSFYVFSSNAAPFEPVRSYNAFGAYTLLEHGGDYAKAAGELAKQGYGTAAEEHPDVDLSGLLGIHKANSSVAVAEVSQELPQPTLQEEVAPEVSEEELRETLIETLPFPEHLYKIQGLVGDVMATTLEYSSTPNRPLALSGALALMSYLAARKVKTPTGLRSNIYLLALAGSGSGKERPRDINQIIIEEVGLSLGLLDGVASGAGLEDMLMVTPALLWQSDEFYSTLEEMLREGVTGTNTVMEKLLKMYTTSHKSYATRAKSGKQPVSIPNPNVTLYATTTPKAFFDHVNDRFLADGMYARLNLMVAEKPSAGHLPLEPKVSQDIIERSRLWALFKPEGSGNTNLKAMLAPYTADAAAMAVELFQKQQKRLVEMRGRDAPEWKCSIWNRYCETALRYALIYACSVAPRPELTVLTPEALRWGGEFVEWEMENKFYMTDKNYFKTDFSRLQDIALTGIRKWHKDHGLDAPMPGWKFNRLLDGQPPNIVKAVTESLLAQERMFFMTSGRGFKYSLKRFRN